MRNYFPEDFQDVGTSKDSTMDSSSVVKEVKVSQFSKIRSSIKNWLLKHVYSNSKKKAVSKDSELVPDESCKYRQKIAEAMPDFNLLKINHSELLYTDIKEKYQLNAVYNETSSGVGKVSFVFYRLVEIKEPEQNGIYKLIDVFLKKCQGTVENINGDSAKKNIKIFKVEKNAPIDYVRSGKAILELDEIRFNQLKEQILNNSEEVAFNKKNWLNQ